MPNQFSQWMQRDGYPLTKAVLLLIVVALFVPSLAASLNFTAPGDVTQPWRLVTYPLAPYDVVGTIFYCIFVWFVCGSLERSWGTLTFGYFFVAITVITALAISAGAMVLRAPQIPVDGYTAAAGFFVGWAMLNPDEPIYVFGIVPVLAKWLALIGMAIVFAEYARVNPFMGVISLAGCLAAYLWTRNRGWRDSFSYAYRAPQPRVKKPKRGKRDDDFTLKSLNPIERYRRAKRKKQFERLFEDDDK